MGRIIIILLALTFDTWTTAMDVIPGTTHQGMQQRTSPSGRNPWFFRKDLKCRPLEIELQTSSVVQVEDCRETCRQAVLSTQSALRTNPEECWRGANICFRWTFSTARISGASISRQREDAYFDHTWDDPASSVYNADPDAGSSSSTANIGCTPLVNTFKQQKKKKKNQVFSTKNDYALCTCRQTLHYQSVLADESCSARAIRSRHGFGVWQVLGDLDEDSGKPVKCNKLDYDLECPGNLEQMVRGRIDLLPDDAVIKLRGDMDFYEEWEDHPGKSDDPAFTDKPFRDQFRVAMDRVMSARDNEQGSDTLKWSDLQDDSNSDC